MLWSGWFASGAVPAIAADPRWEQATPFGGAISALAEAPSASQTLYAFAAVGATFRSLDGGVTWQARGRVPASSLALQISYLRVDAVDSDTLYALSGVTAFRSRDGGASWSFLPVPHLPVRLQPDPVARGTVYAATSSGLLRSADFGDSWTVAAFDGSAVSAIAFDPADSTRRWAAVLDRTGSRWSAWRSPDGGATWLRTRLSVPTSYGSRDLVADPSHPGTWYFADRRVYRTRDDGASWRWIGVSVASLAVAGNGDLLATAVNPYSSVAGGVFRSRDGGATWTPSLPYSLDAPFVPRDWVVQILISSSSPDTVFAAGGTGVWVSNDGGDAWRPQSRGIVALGVSELASTPGGRGVLAISQDADLYRGLDRGRDWRLTHSRWDEPGADWKLTFEPRAPSTLYAFGPDRGFHTAPSVVKSVDSGRTWSKLPFPYGDDLVCSSQDYVTLDAIAVDATRPSSTYVAGGSWGVLCAARTNFLVRSDDDFKTWTSLPQLGSVQSLVVDAGDASTIYALGCNPTVLRRSRDRGLHWQRVAAGLPAPPVADQCGTLVQDRVTGALYAGTAGHGVYVSHDQGSTFQAMAAGLEDAWVAGILVDPVSQSLLYASVTQRFSGGTGEPGGVYRWDASAGRWLPLHDGLPREDFSSALAFDPQDSSVLYAGTATQGVFRLRTRPAADPKR